MPLADGNIGIGGLPAWLLYRCAQLLAPDGRLLIEAEPGNVDEMRGHVRGPSTWGNGLPATSQPRPFGMNDQGLPDKADACPSAREVLRRSRRTRSVRWKFF